MPNVAQIYSHNFDFSFSLQSEQHDTYFGPHTEFEHMHGAINNQRFKGQLFLKTSPPGHVCATFVIFGKEPALILLFLQH